MKMVYTIPVKREYRCPVVHELKCTHPFINQLSDDVKNFEIRKHDRDYQVGDFLVLREWYVDCAKAACTPLTHNEKWHYGAIVKTAVIQYVLTKEKFPGVQEGYCVLGLGGIRQIG